MGSKLNEIEHGLAPVIRLPNQRRPLAAIIAIDDNIDDLMFFRRLRATAGIPHPVLGFQCSQTAGVKLIMVSGSGRSKDRARALRHGADAYFLKFPMPEELARALNSTHAA